MLYHVVVRSIAGRYRDRLFDIGTLGQVVPSAQQLNVFCSQRCAALREGKNVIKVKLALFAADSASCIITRPDLKFDTGWNETSPFREAVRRILCSQLIRDVLHGNEL